MKKLLLMIVALFCVTTMYAQNYQEVVYLKNGSMIKGTVIEQVPNKTYKIKTSDGSIFVFSWNEVQKITKEEVVKRPTSQQGTKYQGEVGIGRGFGKGNFTGDLTYFYTTHGVRFNDYFFLGANVGLAIDDADDMLLSTSANVKGYLPVSQTCSLFASLDTGLAFGITSDIDNIYGTIFAPSIGININNKLTVSIGYDTYSLETNFDDSYYEESFDIYAIVIKVGYAF